MFSMLLRCVQEDFVYGKYDGHHTYFEGEAEKGLKFVWLCCNSLHKLTHKGFISLFPSLCLVDKIRDWN